MNKIITISVLLLSLSFTNCSEKEDLREQFEKYNIEWTRQSDSSMESMPLSGANGFGANVWVKEGIIHLYLASNNSYDENGNLLKLGAVTCELSPNPLLDPISFSQKLDLYNGRIVISGEDKTGLSVQMALWYDDRYNGLHIETQSSSPVKIKPSFATWRTQEKAVDLGSWNHQNLPYVTRPDSVECTENAILFYHRNLHTDIITDHMLEYQDMTNYKDDLVDVTRDLIFGGMIGGHFMKYIGSEPVTIDQWEGTRWNLESESDTSHSIVITSKSDNRKEWEDWKRELSQAASDALAGSAVLEKEMISYWNHFWQKSYILVNMDRDETDAGFQVGRNYQLFRYMLACNRGNRLPLKFNGGIFTFAPMQDHEIKNKPNGYGIKSISPDFRHWGNLFMAQNQRLIGWPALSSGDFDLVEPSLLFYLDRLKIAEDRSLHYWGHDGAAFMEALSLYGLPVNTLSTSTGESSAIHLRHQLSMQIEFAYMALLWSKYSGEHIAKYMPFIESVIQFYDEHYRKERVKSGLPEYDKEGRLVLYPLNSLELFSDATNPVEAVAGLRAVLEELLSLPESVFKRKSKDQYLDLHHRLPVFEYEIRNGTRVLSPAKEYGREWNPWEFPEMYTVWPFSVFRKGKSGYQEALNTWKNVPGSRKEYVYQFWSWQCTPIYAAMLGDLENTRQLIVEKLSDKNANVKFPAFFGPGHDWIPDFNWGGSGMVALQKMILDSDQDFIHLFTAWPEEWDVKFKLYGYDQIQVRGDYRKGQLIDLNISDNSGKKIRNELLLDSL